MFRHPDETTGNKENKEEPLKATLPLSGPQSPPAPPKDVSPEALRELLEKNLKWSQIIYEQNRKIKNALVWKAAVSWLWFVVLVVLPTIGSFWIYAHRDEVIKKVGETINNIAVQSITPSGSTNNSKVDALLKLVPLSPDQQTQLKAMLGK